MRHGSGSTQSTRAYLYLRNYICDVCMRCIDLTIPSVKHSTSNKWQMLPETRMGIADPSRLESHGSVSIYIINTYGPKTSTWPRTMSYTYKNTYTYTYKYTYTYIHTLTPTPTPTHTHTHAHAHAHAHIHTRTHIHTHTHALTHTQTQAVPFTWMYHGGGALR